MGKGVSWVIVGGDGKERECTIRDDEGAILVTVSLWFWEEILCEGVGDAAARARTAT